MVAETLAEETTRRVLIVDDDARVRRALRALIESASGLSLSGEAALGAQALRLDEQLNPDVVLLDLLLPSAQDGLKVLAALVARRRAVVALSIRGALRPAALDAGAVSFVEKGASPDVLLDALREASLSAGSN